MTEHHIKEDIFKALRLLSADTTLSQRDVSKHLDISLGKANYLLKALTKKGLIEIKEFMERGKKLKKIQYILTKDGFEEKARLTYYFLQMKEKEYFELKKEAETSVILSASEESK
jgi:EPS-associated MarR family transcriptional regulator